MDAAHDFLKNLAMVFCVAGVTTLIFQRLKQPVIFGYLLAGFIIGPHTPIPLVADEEIIRTFSELGMILLLFSLGLEFSLRKLVKVGPAAAAIAVGECSAMIWMGYLLGRALGWTPVESIYAGAIVAIGSTMIIIKAFGEQGVKARFTRLVFGVLIVEDLIAIFILSILTTISSGVALTPAAMFATAHRLVLFLAALIGIGLLVVPRLMRMVIKLDRPETTLVASIGLCFACALVALDFGYSVALGAFIGGSLIAESGHGKVVEHLVQPVRDMFGAMFFVAVGMLIDPQLIVEHAGAVLAMAAVVIIGKVTFVSMMSVLTGHDVKTSVQTGMSLSQIGEFSFIIAALGISLGATRPFLYPVAVAVSALTALTTPWLIRASGPTAEWIDRKLPHKLQTYVGLHGTWFERIRHTSPTPSQKRNLRRPVTMLFVDWALLLGIIVGTVLELETMTAYVSRTTDLLPDVSRWIVISVAVFAAAFLIVAVLRVASAVSRELASRAFPLPVDGRVDFAAAPRAALVVTLRIAAIVLLGLPLVAITQPFIPLFRGSALLVIILAALAIAFWRSVTNLQGHAKAGAEVIILALSRQMSEGDEKTAASEGEQRLARIRGALPGLGEPVAVTLMATSIATGRTLAEVNLRGATGATVLAISRGGEDVLLPNGREVMTAGDTLYVAGTTHAVAAARALLLAHTRGDEGEPPQLGPERSPTAVV